MANENSKGPLSVIGDPIGKVLSWTLKPTLGRVTGAIGEPNGEALLAVEREAKNKIAYSGEEDDKKPGQERPGGKRIGGRPQTGQNPLGL